jgi:hypothetical protein
LHKNSQNATLEEKERRKKGRKEGRKNPGSPIKKRAQDILLKRVYSDDKHMKRCSKSLVIREMQIKSTGSLGWGHGLSGRVPA